MYFFYFYFNKMDIIKCQLISCDLMWPHVTYYCLINDYPNDLMISEWSVNVWVVLPFGLAKQRHSDHHYHLLPGNDTLPGIAMLYLHIKTSKTYLCHLLSPNLRRISQPMKNCSEKFDDLWAWRHFRPWLGCSMVSLTRTRLFRFDSDMVEEMAETRDIWKCYFCSGTDTNSIPTNKNLQLPKTIKYHIYFGDSSALLTMWTLYILSY